LRKSNKNIYLVILCVVLIITSLGCTGKREEKSKGDNLSIIIEDGSTSDMDKINKIIDGFKETHKDWKVNVTTEEDQNKLKKIIDSKEFDLFICKRNTLLNEAKNGTLKDLTSYFQQNAIGDKFYNINISYGRVENKNYGLGLFPYSIAFIYNKNDIGKNFVEGKSGGDLISLTPIINRKDFKIPVVVPKELNEQMAISAVIANNVIESSTLEKIYDIGKEKYKSEIKIQEVFNTLNKLSKDYKLSNQYIYRADASVIKDIESGIVPFAFISTSLAKDIKESVNIETLSGVDISQLKISPPVIIEHIVCALGSSKNESQINRFYDYLLDNDTFKEFSKDNLITGNKNSDTEIKGLTKEMIWTVNNAKENNIVYYENLPRFFMEPLNKKINTLINGEYTGTEWNEVVDEAYENKK
jgi:hypothetical protein